MFAFYWKRLMEEEEDEMRPLAKWRAKKNSRRTGCRFAARQGTRIDTRRSPTLPHLSVAVHAVHFATFSPLSSLRIQHVCTATASIYGVCVLSKTIFLICLPFSPVLSPPLSHLLVAAASSHLTSTSSSSSRPTCSFLLNFDTILIKV